MTTPRKRVTPKASDQIVTAFDQITVKQYRVMFDDGKLLDMVGWQDGSSLRERALGIANGLWGKRADRKIAGVGVFKVLGTYTFDQLLGTQS